jgi:hypothetical protein
MSELFWPADIAGIVAELAGTYGTGVVSIDAITAKTIAAFPQGGQPNLVKDYIMGLISAPAASQQAGTISADAVNQAYNDDNEAFESQFGLGKIVAAGRLDFANLTCTAGKVWGTMSRSDTGVYLVSFSGVTILPAQGVCVATAEEDLAVASLIEPDGSGLHIDLYSMTSGSATDPDAGKCVCVIVVQPDED